MKFRQITAPDFGRYSPYFQGLRYELCEYCLVTIIAWTTEEYQPYGAEVDGVLVMYSEYPSDHSQRHLVLPVAPHREYSPDELHALATELDIRTCWFVPDSYLERHGEERIARRFAIAEQTGYEDYVYRVHDLTELPGNRFSKKRNLIHQFERNQAGRPIGFEPVTPANRPDCRTFLEEWCAARECGPENYYLACERLATTNILDNLEHLPVRGLLMRLDGQAVAMALTSPLTASTAVLSCEKAREDIKGLYQYFDRECMRRLFADYQFVNKESDMEIPGLAHSKRSYHPERRVKSYLLTAR